MRVEFPSTVTTDACVRDEWTAQDTLNRAGERLLERQRLSAQRRVQHAFGLVRFVANRS
jgi:hypothetical protein